MEVGKLVKYDNDFLYYKVPAPPTFIVERNLLETAWVLFNDGRTLSPMQRKKCYALLRDISLYSGHHTEELKDIFKAELIARTGEPDFSLSDCSVSTANAFIEMLIEFCLEHGVPCRDTLLEHAPDIGKFLFMCLYHKKCCVCQKAANLHHHDRVGIGRNRKEILHEGMLAQALCHKHHMEAHNGQKSFDAKYYVFGIKLDKILCKKWNLKHS